MNAPDASSYRDWDEVKDGAWFCFQRPRPRSVMKCIRPLAVDYASRLWQWVFPTNKDVLPLVDKKCWLWGVFANEPFWFTGPDEPAMRQYLRQSFPWSENDQVFFLVRSGTGYQTPWRVYLEHWSCFGSWDYEGLLFHPTAREVAVFWEVPAVYVGRRSKRRLIGLVSGGSGL